MTSIITEALEKWRSIKSDDPLLNDVVLYQGDGVVLYVEASYGPAIPYNGIDHGNGEVNHGYLRVKGNPEMLAKIPEVQGFQAFSDLLRQLNSDESPIESLGCEKLESPIDLDHPVISWRIGSYTDIVFSNLNDCQNPELNLELAASILDACRECSQWWSNIEIGLQRLKHYHGTAKPWSLMIRISGYGGTAEQARKMWEKTAGRVGSACIAFNAEANV